MFQAERTLYWNDEGLLLRIEYQVDNPSTSEASVFDIVINDPDGARDENGKKIRIYIDTKNWEGTASLIGKLEELEEKYEDDPDRWEQLAIRVQQRVQGLQKRLEKYRRTGLSIVIEWKGDVPERIKELEKKRRGKLGSVKIVPILEDVR
jgi:hypothetical protein